MADNQEKPEEQEKVEETKEEVKEEPKQEPKEEKSEPLVDEKPTKNEEKAVEKAIETQEKQSPKEKPEKVVEKPVDTDKIADQVRNQIKEEQKQAEDKKREQQNNFIRQWYTEYQQLADMGKVPAVKDAKSDRDAGVLVRDKIIKELGKAIEKNMKQGVNLIPSLSQVLISNPGILKGPAGADAPVFGDSGPSAPSGEFSHGEIRNSSFEELASRSF